MKKSWVIVVLVILIQMSSIKAEYPLVYENRTYYSIIYPSEHMKGEQYTIIFCNDGEVELSTHSEHISMGFYYQNASHRFFEYIILTGIVGGWKTFVWDVYDSEEDLIEIAYVDIHVLLDAYDESSLQQQITTKEDQIRDLQDELGKTQDQNITIEYVDRTFTDMMGEWVEMEKKTSILFWIWIGSIPSMIGVYFAFRSHKLGRAFQRTQTAIKVKTNFWDLTFDKLEDVVSIYAEGVPSSEIEVRGIFQKEHIVFASMFSNKLIDWLTCVPASIKEKFKNVHFLDMSVKERIERIRKWDHFSDISNRYDIWAQLIRTTLIPACIMYPEFWREHIDPLGELYVEYVEKSKELMSPEKRMVGEKESKDVPQIISTASAYMHGGSHVST